MRLSAYLFLGALLVTESVPLECPTCACPASYQPVCAFNNVTRRFRGFSSRCEMDCINDCFNNRFRFVSNNRCGKKKIALGTRKSLRYRQEGELNYDATPGTLDPRRYSALLSLYPRYKV